MFFFCLSVLKFLEISRAFSGNRRGSQRQDKNGAPLYRANGGGGGVSGVPRDILIRKSRYKNGIKKG